MIRCILFFCIFLAAPALAQQVTVRSGAHADFDRLVLYVPKSLTWSVEQDESGAQLTLDGYTDGFDTSSVFDRISGSFISDVTADASSIGIAFSCKCRATVSNEGTNMIVVDVSAALIPEVSPILDESVLSFVGAQALRLGTNQSSKPPEPPQTVANASVRRVEKRELPQSSALEQYLQTEQGVTPDAMQLEQTRNQIARQIGSAATRGILSPIGSGVGLLTNPSKPQIDTKIFDSSLSVDPDLSQTERTSTNLRITSSSDILPSAGRDFPESFADGLSCIDPERVAIQTWANGAGVSEQVADLRSQLYGEFDQLSQSIAVQLTKTYLYFGFGAEARQTLLLQDGLMKKYPELVTIADILEYGYSTEPSFLSDFVECDSDIAFWAILSARRIDPELSIDTDAALRTASALPMHLRSFLAPELSRRLLAYGDQSAAAAALRSLERAPQPLSPIANLAKADLEMAQTDVAQAQARLAEVVTSNTEQSAEALIKFVDSHLAEDAEIDENVATLVEAYALEMRDDPIEAELRRTHVLALGKSGQFTAAFDALSRIRARGTDVNDDALRSSVLDLLTRNADDVEFLEHAFAQMGVSPETLTPQARLQLADRLTRLGFAQQAEAVLNSGEGYKDGTRVALLKAEISLALNRPYEAMAYVYGQESDAASLLRARAESLAGDFSQAHSIYAALDSATASQQAAWLSEDWSDLVEEVTPVFGPMVSVAQSTITDEPQKEGMLQRASAAVSESQNARLAIEELLNSNELRVPASE